MHVSKDTKERGKARSVCFSSLSSDFREPPTKVPGYGGFSRQVVDSAARGKGGGGDTLLVRKRETENWNPSNAGIKRKSEDGESRLTTPSCNDALWSTTCSGNKIRDIKNKGARRIQKTTKEGGKGKRMER